MSRLSIARSPLGIIRSLLRQTRGATAIEYGLILAVIALGISASLTQVGTTIATTFDRINSYLVTTR
ncbi:Flp family type IVb pilin [Sphingomonas phyllosphaerae]|uniref:Flp family type IVb pilin n=1 Tax=Sphingomonas phyllosphaerae TaxID=257003 RepID=UPI0003B5D7CA|nr:Flp family type IVb pilin [Sphingomonas phyllosphaerae]